MMQKILKIAQREYIETVKTKTFIIGLLMVPLIIIGIIFFAGYISQDNTGPRPPIRVAVTDLSNELSAKIKNTFDEYNSENPKRQIFLQELESQKSPETIVEQGKNKLRRRQIDAYVVLDNNIIEGAGKIHLYTYKPEPVNLDAFWTIKRLLSETVVSRRYEVEQIEQELLDELDELRKVTITQVEIGSGADEERVQSDGRNMTRMMIPFFFMLMIYMGIMVTGQHMLSSVIEEKNSRVIEVLLSAVSPFELMAGKILGLAGIGLTVTALWAFAAYGTSLWQGLNVDITNELMVYFAIYYILGFILFSSILAGVGSLCNTIKETQSLMMPITLVLIIPFLTWFRLVQSPAGTLARALSFVPILTPMVMILRLSASSNIWMIEIIASIVVLAASVLVVIWAAGKVFRTGILMYGKRPGLLEVLRWLKQS